MAQIGHHTSDTRLLVMCPECQHFWFFAPDAEVVFAAHSHWACVCGRVWKIPDEIDQYINVTDEEVYAYWEALARQAEQKPKRKRNRRGKRNDKDKM